MMCPEDEAQAIALNNMIISYLNDETSLKKLAPNKIWKFCLKLIKNEEFTKAFELLLRFGDDIYVLRACIICGGDVIRRMHKRTAQKVLLKLSEIKLGGRIDSTYLSLMEKGIKRNLLDNLDFETCKETKQALGVIGSHFHHALKNKANYLETLVIELIKYN